MYRTLLSKYYVDEAYDRWVVEPTKRLGVIWDWFDQAIIDGAVRAIGRLTETGGATSTWIEKYVIYGFLNLIGYGNHLTARAWRKLQTGKVHHYAAILVAGLFLLVHFILVWWTGAPLTGIALR